MLLTHAQPLRETISACTCNWRSSRSTLQSQYPTYQFDVESAFPETDNLWKEHYTETLTSQSIRVKQFLDDIFSTDKNTIISMTSHGGLIAPILEAVGHPNPKFNLTTGQVIPALVRAVTGPDLVGDRGMEPMKEVRRCARCG